MRIKEELKESGYFWIPSAPDKRIPGILSISDGEIIKLELFGMFGTFNDNSRQIERIVGHVEKMGFVTLDDCYCKSTWSSVDTSRTFDELVKSSIEVMKVFTGAAYRAGEIPRFDTLTFSVEGIDEWVGISGIEVDHQLEQHAAAISYKLPEDITLTLDNNMELLIAFSWQPPPFSLVPKEAKVTQKTHFHLVSQDARELDMFISVANKLTTFLCFAMNEIVCLDSMSTVFDTPHQDVREGLRKMTSVNIYCHSGSYSEDIPEIHWHNMLFRFEKIQGNAERMINNWVRGYEQFAHAFHLYFWARRNAYPYLEVRFLSLVQGLEAYHRGASDEKEMDKAEFEELIENLIDHCPGKRKEWLEGRLRHSNEVSLRKRMRRLIEPFKDLFGNQEKRKSLINRIVDTRNSLTHPSSEAEGIEDLWILCQKMEVLFQLHFLQLIGFSREEIRSIGWDCQELRQKLEF